jgi:hypothetical protein
MKSISVSGVGVLVDIMMMYILKHMGWGVSRQNVNQKD